jgi:hypothetical protein
VNTSTRNRSLLLATAMVIIVAASTRLNADTGTCGGASITLPFTDVPSSNSFFCSIAEAYFSALTNGTSATTYSPSDPVPREQMAAFITRTMDQALERGSKRAVLDQFWTTQGANNLGLTTVGGFPWLVKSDGADVWVANTSSGTVSRVRASDGRLLETWSGAFNAKGVLVAMGKVFVTGVDPSGGLGALFQIDPTQPAGAVTTLSTVVGQIPAAMAFDGQRIWTANQVDSVSIVTLNPITVTNVFTGFSSPVGILYDGANIWVTDAGDDKLKRLDSNGAILQSVPVGSNPHYPAFDGTNIWVPNSSVQAPSLSTVSVVRASGGSAGTVIATLSGNGLNSALSAAFDGERILVTNAGTSTVALWKATDLTPIGTFPTGVGTAPFGACSDGLNFWITLHNTGQLARF